MCQLPVAHDVQGAALEPSAEVVPQGMVEPLVEAHQVEHGDLGLRRPDGQRGSMGMVETLIVIYTPPGAPRPFWAGVVARDGKVIQTAHILHRHIKKGWSGQQVADYCKAKGWIWERVQTVTD